MIRRQAAASDQGRSSGPAPSPPPDPARGTVQTQFLRYIADGRQRAGTRPPRPRRRQIPHRLVHRVDDENRPSRLGTMPSRPCACAQPTPRTYPRRTSCPVLTFPTIATVETPAGRSVGALPRDPSFTHITGLHKSSTSVDQHRSNTDETAVRDIWWHLGILISNRSTLEKTTNHGSTQSSASFVTFEVFVVCPEKRVGLASQPCAPSWPAAPVCGRRS